MYTEEKIDKFIELRARGWSLGHIATDLDVSKRTLVDWNREYAKDVQSVHALELELLKEKIIASREEQLDHLHRLQKDNRPTKSSSTNWPNPAAASLPKASPNGCKAATKTISKTARTSKRRKARQNSPPTSCVTLATSTSARSIAPAQK